MDFPAQNSGIHEILQLVNEHQEHQRGRRDGQRRAERDDDDGRVGDKVSDSETTTILAWLCESLLPARRAVSAWMSPYTHNPATSAGTSLKCRINRRPAATRIQAAFSGPVARGRESVPAAGTV
jgi:hypothetical protein